MGELETKLVRVVNARPPNFAEIVNRFPAAAAPSTIFAYGDVVYYAGTEELPKSLLAHEAVHLRQQNEPGQNPELWWGLYLANDKFRFEQELEAHLVEYAHVLGEGVGRHARRRARKQIAARLSGPLYGKCVSLSKALAYLKTVENVR